jgi:ATP-dependent DNA ligase
MTIQLPRLFGRSTTGAVKVWDCRVEDHGTHAHIMITHGQEHGTPQETVRVVTEGKNAGRANATTPWAQAVAEAKAFWNKKQDKGYSTVRTSDPQRVTRLPMLALTYEDRKHHVVWPAFVQPKLNGVRCLMERVGDDIVFHSRGNKRFVTLDHLKADALAVLKDGEILDGELYSHGDITFQELCSLIKNEKNPDIDKVTRYIKFYNYDRCDPVPFVRRASRLAEHGHIKRVPTYRVQNEAEMFEYHRQFVEDGFEGTMLRSGGDDPYRFQYRSASLLKYKDFLDAEFVIVGAAEGVGKSVGQATFMCTTENGKTFGCRCKGTDEMRREQWTNRASYMGKKLTVKYQTLSDDGIPVFPVGIAVRDTDYDC